MGVGYMSCNRVSVCLQLCCSSSRWVIVSSSILILFITPITSQKGTGTCKPGTPLQGTNPPSRKACNTDTGAECCTSSRRYTTYDCSPAISSLTPAILNLNDFTKGGDGGDPSYCENKYYSRDELVVALSTGWFDNGSRCKIKIRISWNGKSVEAKVVDECDSRNGCDKEHGYQPPCRYNIVDGSVAVWKALGVPKDRQGDDLSVTWSLP